MYKPDDNFIFQMKNLLIAGLVGLAQTQNADIITNQNQIAPPSDGGVIFNQDGENHVVEYRKDFNEDDCKYKSISLDATKKRLCNGCSKERDVP